MNVIHKKYLFFSNRGEVLNKKQYQIGKVLEGEDWIDVYYHDLNNPRDLSFFLQELEVPSYIGLSFQFRNLKSPILLILEIIDGKPNWRYDSICIKSISDLYEKLLKLEDDPVSFIEQLQLYKWTKR